MNYVDRKTLLSFIIGHVPITPHIVNGRYYGTTLCTMLYESIQPYDFSGAESYSMKRRSIFISLSNSWSLCLASHWSHVFTHSIETNRRVTRICHNDPYTMPTNKSYFRDNRLVLGREFLSTPGFGTSMSAYCILVL